MNIKDQIINSFEGMKSVIVAMSGGVDSSVAAWAAKQAGCKVTGVTLQLYDSGESAEDARRVADMLGIDWILADYRNYFGEDVLSPYIATYKKGLTPNPCCICNRVGKTKYLFDMMQKAGAEHIVTGHYARLAMHKGAKYIYTSYSDEKDQSYYLSLMDPFHIQFMHYPLSVVEKTDVRALAAELSIPVADKRDSYEACFLNGEDYREFLKRHAGSGKGGYFNLHGKRLTEHLGVGCYTIGQRRGLDISHTEPLYVKSIDIESGEIVLAEKKELFTRLVRMKECVFREGEPVLQRVKARLRHKMKIEDCLLEIQQGGRAVILFDKPQFAPAPGQITALYDGERLMGGGIVYL
jgi:tRNA-specific 2-thiouridylase